MTIKLFTTSKLTEEQKAVSSMIEQELSTIINSHGHYNNPRRIESDCHSKIANLNKKSKSAFKGGLYHYQVKNYHIQMFLENKYRTPMLRRGMFKFEEEIFRSAYLKALSISIYNTKTIYPIQTKMICMWLLSSYFAITGFKPQHFDNAFEIADDCMDEDFSLIEDSWKEIDEWAESNREAIDEGNNDSNERRKFRRRVKRILKRRLKPHELKWYHCSAHCSNSYENMIKTVSDTYHISERTVLKKAKELNITPDTYKEIYVQRYEAMQEEQREIEYYTECLKKGPYGERESREKYYKRFSRFRTFGSTISPMNEEEQAECDKINAEQAKIHIQNRQNFNEWKAVHPLVPDILNPYFNNPGLFTI